MLTKIAPTYNVTIYIAGDLNAARESLRRECLADGLCVTVTACDYVFTGGMESGVAVGFINYPRFTKTSEQINGRAIQVAQRLMADLCQLSVSIVTPTETIWLSNRPEDNK